MSDCNSKASGESAEEVVEPVDIVLHVLLHALTRGSAWSVPSSASVVEAIFRSMFEDAKQHVLGAKEPAQDFGYVLIPFRAQAAASVSAPPHTRALHFC